MSATLVIASAIDCTGVLLVRLVPVLVNVVFGFVVVVVFLGTVM